MGIQSAGTRRSAAILSAAARGVAFDLLLVAVVAPLAAVLCLSGWGTDFPFSSDGVMPYILFDDFFRHGGRPGAWVYPIAPYWFPDTALAWAIRSFTSDIFSCVFAYAVIQSALFLLLMRWVFACIAKSEGSTSARILWLSWLFGWVVLVAAGARNPVSWYAWLYRYVFYPNIHSGTLLVALLGIGVWIKASAAQSVRGAVALSLLCFVALISDQAFALWFIVPVCAALLVPGHAARWRWLAAGSMASAFVAYRILRFLVPSTFFGAALLPEPNLARSSMETIVADLWQLLSQDWIFSLYEGAVFATLAGLSLTAWRKRRGSTSSDRMFRLWMFLGISIALPVIASIALGRHANLTAFRYYQPLCLAGLVIPITLRPWLQRFERTLSVALPVLTVAVMAIAGYSSKSWSFGSFRIPDARSAQIECERNLVARYHARIGFAEYWNTMSVMARIPGLTLVPLRASDLHPSTMLNTNLDWLSPSRRPDPGDIEILDEGALDSGRMDALFGPPDERVVCPQSAIRIYRTRNGRPSLLAKLHDRFAWATTFQRFQVTGEVDVPASAWSTNPSLDRGDVIVVDGDYPVRTELLSVASDMNPDAEEMWIDYEVESAAPNATLAFELYELDESGSLVRVLGKSNLPLAPGAKHETVFKFRNLRNPPEMPKQVGIRVTASGRMKAVVEGIGWRR